MTLTDAEKAALDNLDSALSQANRALSHDDVNAVIVDWAAVYVETWWDDDGKAKTRLSWITPGDGMPHYRLVGLLRTALMDLEDERRTPDA